MNKPRILLLGATGYTGELTAHSLITEGVRPVLLGRSQAKLESLARELGGLETALVDTRYPATLMQVLQPSDVLISTVGPFLRFGSTAVQVAAEMGVHYLDSTGEGPFIREVFERWGPIAKRNGTGLLTAFGYDYVPGALAGALALEEAGPEATSVDIGYFSTGFSASKGTQASTIGVLLEENYTYLDGAIRPQQAGSYIRDFHANGEILTAASVPAAEHFGLPQSYPRVQNINVGLGFPPKTAKVMARASKIIGRLGRFRLLATGISALADRSLAQAHRGPDAAERMGSTATVVAIARAEDRELATVQLDGPNPYEVTADLLAWGATTIAAGGLHGAGALGPTKAFGLEALTRGCARAGMLRRP